MSITEKINNIRKAVLGRDVRENIASAIEECYKDASTKDNANMEVKQSRGTFDTLNERLNNTDNNISNLKSTKAEKKDLEETNRNVSVNSARIDTLVASPSTDNTELIDIRVMADGTTASTAGEAVREQIKEMDDFSEEKITSNNFFDNIFDEAGYIDPTTGEDKDSSKYKRTKNYHKIIKNGLTYLNINLSGTTATFTLVLYDSSKNRTNKVNVTTTTESYKLADDDYYFRIYTDSSFTGKVYVSCKKVNGSVDYTYSTKRFLNAEDLYNNIIGKTIVNFGDSIFGNFRDETSISNQLATMCGATVFNCGFGGCQMSNRGTSDTQKAWSAFSMYALADSICSGDWSYQEANKNYGTTSGNTIPSYFADTTLPLLKSIDFSKVDLITIAYGTNDYTAGTTIADTSTGYDVTTYIGALKYTIKKIQTTYPNIKILVITPIWRYFADGTDSDTKDYAGTGTLLDYKNALISACKSMRIPVLDSYENLSLSEFNAEHFFETGDKTHLNAAGRKMYAELINGKIKELY